MPVALDDFLIPRRLADLREVYAEAGGWQDVCGTYQTHEGVDVETWRATPDAQRLFHYEELFRAAPGRELSNGVVASVRLRMMFGHPAFIDWLGELTGLQVGASQPSRPRRMRRGHYLRSHSDHVLERTLCLVLYLHETWTQELGAAFEMVHAGRRAARVDPLPSRLLLFRPLPGTAHCVLPFGDGADVWERRSLSNWYAPPA
jgi:Rps23 Pro-64 3,4-dihydroxylase Tpa1-like proline 4-hydroxylase